MRIIITIVITIIITVIIITISITVMTMILNVITITIIITTTTIIVHTTVHGLFEATVGPHSSRHSSLPAPEGPSLELRTPNCLRMNIQDGSAAVAAALQ